MLTYQVRERVLFLNHRDERLSFPGDGECRFTDACRAIWRRPGTEPHGGEGE